MTRRRKIHKEGHYPKQSYKSRDNTRLRIINYLFSKGDYGKNRSDIMHNAKLSTQQWGNFDDTINDLVGLQWITKVPISSKSYIYKISETGRNVIKKTLEIIEDKHPIKDLDAFNEIDQL